MKEVGILGGGAMAKAIIHLLNYNNIPHKMCSRTHGNIEQISSFETVFICISSEGISQNIKILQGISQVISCSKGIFSKEKPFTSSVFAQGQFCILSGPNFANEIISSQNTITTIASENAGILACVSKMLQTPFFQIETTQNVKGVEMCAILKNAIAIIIGYISAKTQSWNEKSLILTKVFQESITVMKHFGIETDILNMSCGIGDLFLTCSTPTSRNYKFGFNMYHKKQQEDATVEGVRSLEFLQQVDCKLPYLKDFGKDFLLAIK